MITNRSSPIFIEPHWLAGAFVALTLMGSQGSNAQSHRSDGESGVTVRGIVSPMHSAELRVNLRARVARTPFKTGESFKKGETLILFDCSEQKADVAAAYASLAAAKSKHTSDLEMLKHQAIGELDVDLSKAQMNEAAAISRAARARTKYCEIKAPYAGRVASLFIKEYETPTPEQPLMKIVGSQDLELQLVVPSKWLAWIAKGTSFEFYVDETGIQHTAKVVRVGAEVDAVSRTVEIFGAFDEVPKSVLPGMSGAARFLQAGT